MKERNKYFIFKLRNKTFFRNYFYVNERENVNGKLIKKIKRKTKILTLVYYFQNRIQIFE